MSIPDFSAEPFLAVPASACKTPQAVRLNTLDKQTPIEVSILLCHKMDPAAQAHSLMSRESYARKHGASEEHIARVTAFAHQFHLSVSAILPEQRLVKLQGKIVDFERAFRVSLSHYRDSRGHVFSARSGELHLPASFIGFVEGVFGLDNRPIATPKFQVAKKQGRFVNHEASPYSFFPDQLPEIYGFPAKATGDKQCIAIIELGGGYRIADLRRYFKSIGLPVPSVSAVSVDGGFNNPSTADSADAEVMLDIEVAGAVAPGASIVVYFAPNTEKGFLSAISAAVHDQVHQPSIMSISWGSAENNWSKQALQGYDSVFQTAALLGVTVCAASGDTGSSDGEMDGLVHVDFPASSPHVLACGGTTLTVLGTSIANEVVWHTSDRAATGGGVSDFFALPDYQQKVSVPVSLNTGYKGRGIPDVAANADPETGYRVLVDGQQLVIGGTSAVAPLLSGLFARLNELKGKKLGFVHPKLYNGTYRYRDIIVGDNITTYNRMGYEAQTGWDACSGLGVLSGLK